MAIIYKFPYFTVVTIGRLPILTSASFATRSRIVQHSDNSRSPGALSRNILRHGSNILRKWRPVPEHERCRRILEVPRTWPVHPYPGAYRCRREVFSSRTRPLRQTPEPGIQTLSQWTLPERSGSEQGELRRPRELERGYRPQVPQHILHGQLHRRRIPSDMPEFDK